MILRNDAKSASKCQSPAHAPPDKGAHQREGGRWAAGPDLQGQIEERKVRVFGEGEQRGARIVGQDLVHRALAGWTGACLRGTLRIGCRGDIEGRED